MLKNYLIIAWRNFRKHKSFSLINVLGLAVGMACFILIMLYVQYELSFDRFHEKADRIYRVVAHQPGNVYLGTDHFAVTQAVLGKTLKEEFPEVLQSVALDDWKDVLITAGESFYEDVLLWADASIFEVFTFPLVEGDPKTALIDPYTIILSESIAQKYFGNENPLGKIVRLRDQHDLKVTGVMKEVPRNSHIHFNLIASFQTLVATTENKDQFTKWGNSSFYNYVLVSQDFDPKAFEAKLVQIVKKYHTEDWRDKENPHRYYLQPLTDIHLHSHINFDIGKNNDIRYLYLLSGLAIIIILTACINYMNLATARASLRAKEVGMRKVVGASRVQLLGQFIGESMLLTLTAAIIALLVVELFLPAFSKLVERDLSFDLLLQGKSFLGVVAAVFFVGIISGSYPALFLTAFQPAKVLKGEIKDSGGRSRLRGALVVLQFAASVALIICTATVQKQLEFIKNKKLGYNREQVLVVRMRDREAVKKFDLIKHDLLANPSFINVTSSAHLPINVGSQTGLQWTEREGQEGLSSYQTTVDHDFIDVFEIEMVEGRKFSRDFLTDSSQAFIINEKLRDMLGWETAVGKPFGDGEKPDGTVIGVMKNFHMHSFREEIHPLFIQLSKRWSTYASARIRADNIAEAVEHARTVWEKYSANYPFDYFFLDDEFNRMYESEEKLSQIFGYFTFLAIFIACLGLFGLASFTAERKTKEIGIRKVLGASLAQLLLLLSKDFIKLVIVANLIAWPIVWYALNQWLQGFAYRTSLGWTTLALTATIALLIALATVSVQTVRAAMANPIEALRYE